MKKIGMEDPSKRAAIMEFKEPPTPSAAAIPSLASQYNAMTVKRGKKTFPKACEGAAKCKNVLCEHKFAPIGALTGSPTPLVDHRVDPQLLKIIMAKSEKDGYDVSGHYAMKMLQKNDYKLIPALNEIKSDINQREYALHTTGRVNFAYERASLNLYSCPARTTHSSDCHMNGLPKSRDGFITALEYEDKHLADCLTAGWKSFYGQLILSARYKTAAQRENAFKVYSDEAKYRADRQAFWEEVRGQGDLSQDEIEICMEKWEDGHKPTFGECAEHPEVNGKENSFRGSLWRKEIPVIANAVPAATQGNSSTSTSTGLYAAQTPGGESSSSASASTPPRTKVYHHPVAVEIIDNTATPTKGSVLETITEDTTEEAPQEEPMAKGKIEYDPEGKWHHRFSEENIRFVKQQEADTARYMELMSSVADDDLKIATLRAQASTLIQENKDLNALNHELKFRATQRLLEEIDNPPEPQVIQNMVTKIADWDLKFDYALDEDDLPVLCSHELFELLDKLCKNIYLVSVQTIGEETRPAIRKAWEAINFGGRSFHSALKSAVVTDRGLMEETLCDKLGKAIEMSMLLEQTFQNLDTEIPVLNRKAKRNRVEDKKLQGMLKQCLGFSMKVCAYPTDLSWAGVNKLKREVGGIPLQKQMELKYMGLASSDPPTETMNKKNAATYIQLITAARKIDDLLKTKTPDPITKYKDMLKIFYVDKVHPASFLPNWKILIKDEETHDMMAMLVLIAADEDEGKYGQVIQIFREAIHEDLHALHSFAKKDPKEFMNKANYKFLVEVIGDPGQLKFDELSDYQIWDWIVGFQLAKSRLGGDVKGALGWALKFDGQTAVQSTAQDIVDISDEEDGDEDVEPIRAAPAPTHRPISTPRRVQQSLRKSLSKEAILSKIGKNESLEEAIDRLNMGVSSSRAGRTNPSGSETNTNLTSGLPAVPLPEDRSSAVSPAVEDYGRRGGIDLNPTTAVPDLSPTTPRENDDPREGDEFFEGINISLLLDKFRASRAAMSGAGGGPSSGTPTGFILTFPAYQAIFGGDHENKSVPDPASDFPQEQISKLIREKAPIECFLPGLEGPWTDERVLLLAELVITAHKSGVDDAEKAIPVLSEKAKGKQPARE